ncbi:hypothetical protein [Natronorubrum sulfidifaciens]|uniref:Uncharacterized protein n=1 Tax=Natronorubrum sulfidifaciens JCM 14089 TaxID=1230460 RepID=L9W2H2_9EURY|nr:hypothetical protein [Natronorubrum sulfidifaciens]ELY42498.1 hypothetical protein C495_14322 [Natronorubrum sulfidifaciens JCM 14089]
MARETDTDTESGGETEHAVARSAVRDAIFDAIGTVVLLGFSLVFLFVGVRGLVVGSSLPLSAAFIAASLLVAGAALDLVPPFRG